MIGQLLEYDADLLTAGVSPAAIRPMASRHLSLCPKCQMKFAGWLEALERNAKSAGLTTNRRSDPDENI